MTRLLWPAYRMFPYERDLAAREVFSLVGATANEVGDGLEVISDDVELLRTRVTYARAVVHGDEAVDTIQSAVEEASQRQRHSAPIARQATRFLVHGLHEYKGKFNPQLARTLVNIADPEATSLLDPFCGSGTALVEGVRLGLKVAGIDHHPLAAWMTRVKIATLTERRPDRLLQEFHHLRRKSSAAIEAGQQSGIAAMDAPLDHGNLAYLRKWFPSNVLAGLLGALGAAAQQPGLAAELVRLAVSAIARSVSWQLPEDLRVRRRPPGWTPPRVASQFDDACQLIETTLAELAGHDGAWARMSWSITHGSCDNYQLVEKTWAPGRRLIVTSPPYATALPYIDTDRLSLTLLGLTSPHQLAALERSLIGSREWNRADAANWISRWTCNTDQLPRHLLELLATIDKQNQEQHAGFRRGAVPPLLYRYFASMGASMSAWSEHMQPGERAVLVIGLNRTGPKDHQIVINTPEFLADLANGHGFKPVDIIPLETWPRYGMHARNGVNAESAVVLERQS